MKVFVYGTLKKNFNNHKLLMNSIYLGDRKTLSRYSMFNAGFPVVMKDMDKDYPRQQVAGELYQVTGKVMQYLDTLEANGRMYDRELISVYGNVVAPTERAWMYFGNPSCWGDNNWQPEDVIAHWP